LGASYREAALWLRSHTDRLRGDADGHKDFTVSLGWLWWCARGYLPEHFRVVRNSQSTDVNYAVVLTHNGEAARTPGREIYRVRRMGATLAVVKEVNPPARPDATPPRDSGSPLSSLPD
jgi:hypothetical protein